MEKKKRRSKIDIRTWVELRAAYASAKFPDIRALHEHCKTTMKRGTYPTFQTLTQRAKEERWSLVRAEETKKLEATTLEMFAAQGMPKTEAINICIEGMTAGRTLITELEEKLKEGTPAAADILNFIQKMNTNLHVAKGYLQEYNKMTGCYAPAQMESTVLVQQDEEYNKAYQERLEKIKK